MGPDEIGKIKSKFKELPSEYVDYLSGVGAGECASGRMIYSGPISPDKIFPDRKFKNGIVLLGDDFQGNCLGYDLESKCYGEVIDSGDWEPWNPNETFLDYVSE